jgi:hypothetical protein
VLARLRAAYEANLQDGELLRLDEPIAVLDSIAHRLMERLAAKDTPAWRVRLLDTLTAAQRAERAGDTQEAARLMADLGTLLRSGGSEDDALERLAQHLDRLARRIEGAWSVRLASGEAVNKRDLTAMLVAFLELIATEVGQETAARIARRLEVEILRPSQLLDAPRSLQERPDASEDERMG